jgi:DNA polymerase-1
MTIYAWDIEANGFQDVADTIWVSVMRNLETKELHVFSDHDDKYPNVSKSFKLFDEATGIIAHNGMRYDRVVLEKVTGYAIDRNKIIDTVIYSRLNDFHRKKTGRRHSLKALAVQAGEEQKLDYDGGFDNYSDEMVEYCIADVDANISVYDMLIKEYDKIIVTNPTYDDAIKVEHQVAYWSGEQIKNGWKINETLLAETITKIKGEMDEIENRVEHKLGTLTITIDKEPKTAKYKKNGEYTAVSARLLGDYFGRYIDVSDALSSSPPIKPGEEFQRKETVEARLGNQEHLKEFLYTLGWEPTQWNWKKINGNFVKVSPKLTTDSLVKLGDIGVDIDLYFTLRARHSILNGWKEHIHDGRLYGDVIDIGAATGRQTHKIIANIPSPKATYGSEIRSMFICPDDKVLISADGAGYQARVVAHFGKDKEMSDEILKGDIHQKNADAINCTRNEAKPFFFAFLFGAGGNKLGTILGRSAQAGNKAKDAFLNRWPALAALTDQVKNVSQQRGYLRGLDGRRIYTEESYKAFNYLIQGTEAILMKRTIVRINEAFETEGIEAKQLLFYHDECTWEISPTDTKRAEAIIRKWFIDAPKELGVTIMEAGDCKVGKDYLEVH